MFTIKSNDTQKFSQLSKISNPTVEKIQEAMRSLNFDKNSGIVFSKPTSTTVVGTDYDIYFKHDPNGNTTLSTNINGDLDKANKFYEGVIGDSVKNRIINSANYRSAILRQASLSFTSYYCAIAA